MIDWKHNPIFNLASYHFNRQGSIIQLYGHKSSRQHKIKKLKLLHKKIPEDMFCIQSVSRYLCVANQHVGLLVQPPEQ